MDLKMILAVATILMAVAIGPCFMEEYYSGELEDRSDKTDKGVGATSCEYVKCRYRARCEVIDGGIKCICPKNCPYISRPVCGSNGKTYVNECILEVYGCKNKVNVKVAHEGRCKYGSEKDDC